MIWIFLLSAIKVNDSLPPLPLDKLWKIEMVYHDTLFAKLKIDSFYAQMYVGNILSGDLSFKQPLKKRLLGKFSLHGSKNYDFSEVYNYRGTIDISYLTKKSLQEFNLSVQRKNRAHQDYETGKLSYTPTWFIGQAVLQLKNSFGVTRYIDRTRKHFLWAHSNFILNYPTLIGNVHCDTDVLFQNQFISIFKLNNFITIGDNFSLKPEITYEPKRNRLGFSIQNGFFIKNFTLLADYSKSQTELCYFDTLYQHLYSILVNDDLAYPITDWQGMLSLSIKHHRFSVHYQQYQSYITYNLQDSWFIPVNDNSKFHQYTFRLQNRCRFLNSSAVLGFVPQNLILIPNYFFAESLQIILNNFDINLNVFLSGNRPGYQQILSSFWLLTPEIGYNLNLSTPQHQLRKLRFFLGAENILNNKYEILPNKLHYGRKLIVGVAYYQ